MKTINPQPIIDKLAARCLTAKGVECSVLGEVIDMLRAAPKAVRTPEDNPYWQNICAIAEKQRNKGIETYGQGIESNPADIITRLEYLEEELVDALMYCEWIKDYIGRLNDGK